MKIGINHEISEKGVLRASFLKTSLSLPGMARNQGT